MHYDLLQTQYQNSESAKELCVGDVDISFVWLWNRKANGAYPLHVIYSFFRFMLQIFMIC